MIPAILGLAVTQINMFVDTLLATYLPEGSVSYLYYSNRLVQLPLGLFGIAMGTVVLPAFSLQTASNDLESKRETLISSLCLVLFVCMPAMVGLIVLRYPLIAVLFERGAFTKANCNFECPSLLFFWTLGLCKCKSVSPFVLRRKRHANSNENQHHHSAYKHRFEPDFNDPFKTQWVSIGNGYFSQHKFCTSFPCRSKTSRFFG